MTLWRFDYKADGELSIEDGIMHVVSLVYSVVIRIAAKVRMPEFGI